MVEIRTFSVSWRAHASFTTGSGVVGTITAPHEDELLPAYGMLRRIPALWKRVSFRSETQIPGI